tara:strand:- start:12390 stop:13202 length:813 start_codon:yes stop_codon:yes gene_type:complete
MSFSYTIYGDEGDQFATASTQRQPLGTRMVMRDGRVYRYSRNSSTAISAGLLLVQAAEVANSTGYHILPVDEAAGSTSILLDATGSTGAFSANELKEGIIFFSATGATGQSEPHMIYQHAAWTTVTGTQITFHLYPGDSIQNAWDTSTGVVGIHKNKYRDAVPSSIALGSAGHPVGVSNIPVAASYYYWAQTWGLCPVEISNAYATIKGSLVSASTDASTTGTICRANPTTDVADTTVSGSSFSINPAIGTVAKLAADGFPALVDLTIAP